MGVAWVFEYTGSAREVERLLETGGAESIGTYSVDSMPYVPAGGVGHLTNYLLHHSNFPQTSFSIALSATSGHAQATENIKQAPRATCDRGFDLILSKMSAGLTPDQAGKYELAGHEYRVGDFVVRVGTASQVTNVKGVIVEVDYEPTHIASQAIYMLTEFIANFFPTVKEKPDIINKTVPEAYTPLETLWQYLLIFRTMRNRSH